MAPTSVTPVPPVTVRMWSVVVDKLIILKSTESPFEVKLKAETKFAAVSVAFERASPGVIFKICVLMNAPVMMAVGDE